MLDATVVWIAEGAAASSTSPSDDARLALEAWARARGMKLASPSYAEARAKAIDWAAGDRVERELTRAREALAGLDFDGVERALARAEATLREHAELPQAAWLRAEVERAWSSRWLRGNDEARAKRAWQRATSLDGGRAASLGEKAFDAGTPVTATIRIAGQAGKDASLRLDGALIAPGEVTRGEGDHLLAVIRRDGSIAWSDWVSLAQGGVVTVNAPSAPSCSRDDLEPVRLRGDAVAAAGVQCGRWVAVANGAPGVEPGATTIRVATCERGSCGPLVEWRVATTATWTFPPVAPSPAESRSHWPAWATWTLAGVGVAGAAIAIIVATGALKPAPTETHFVNGGLQIHSF